MLSGVIMMIDINEIKKVLPHRFPFLLIDRVLEVEPGKRVLALKNITVNDVFSQEYFGGLYPMQGVLQVESMAQAAAYLILNNATAHGSLAYFSALDKIRFRHPCQPGDQLMIEVKVLKLRARASKLIGQCTVDGKVTCEGKFSCMLAPEETISFEG
jgi:beta-hydroxyacyl-ACP dehydratase FabZ